MANGRSSKGSTPIDMEPHATKPAELPVGTPVQCDTVDGADLVKGVGTQSGSGIPDSGSRALMRAILQDAILCLKGSGTEVRPGERARSAAQAFRWIVSRDVTWIFSFESICHVLDIDPGFLRARLLRAAALGCDGDAAPRRPHENRGADEAVGTLRTVRLRGNQTARTLRARHSSRSSRGTQAVHRHLQSA
jgi:hypothetical protein